MLRISDDYSKKAMRELYYPQGSDNRIISELHFWDKLFGLTYEEAKLKYLGEVGR